jgi:hypothetical protein
MAAGRHQELLEVLALQRFPFWHERKFGMRALVSEGRTEEALACAEASRGLNQPDAAIDAAFRSRGIRSAVRSLSLSLVAIGGN